MKTKVRNMDAEELGVQKTLSWGQKLDTQAL